MDPRSPALNHRLGLGLVEVLVALVLLAVVGASALLLLRAVRDGTEGIGRLDPRDAVEDEVETLRDDLLHLMRPWAFPGQERSETLRVENGNLAWTRYRESGLAGIRYEREGDRVHRIETQGGVSHTNLWLENVGEWNVKAWNGKDWVNAWPLDKESLPPKLVHFHLSFGDGEQRSLRLPIPAGLSVTGATQRAAKP